MNHIMIPYFYSPNTHHMRVYSIPITNFYIMPNNRVRLYKVIIPYMSIRGHSCKSTYHITFSQKDIGTYTSSFMNQRNKFSTLLQNQVHTYPTRFPSNRTYKDILILRNIRAYFPNNRRINIINKSIQSIHIIIYEPFNHKFRLIANRFLSHIV